MTDALAHALNSIKANIVLDENDPDSAAQYGVKGMKWGVRRGSKGRVSTSLTLDKKARRERTGVTSRAGSVGVMFGIFTTPIGGLIAYGVAKHLAEKDYMADKGEPNKLLKKSKGEIRRETKKLNADPKYKGKNLKKDPELQKQYFKDYADRANSVLRKNAKASTAGKDVSFNYDPEKDAFPYLAVKRKDR